MTVSCFGRDRQIGVRCAKIPSRRQISHHRIEHRKSGLRHPQPSAGIDGDGAFAGQQLDPAGIERAARQSRIALRVDALGEPQPHQQKFIGALFAVQDVIGDDTIAGRLDRKSVV